MPYGRRVPRGTRSLQQAQAGRRAPRYRHGPGRSPAMLAQWRAAQAEQQRQFGVGGRGRRAPRYR